MLIDTHCHVNFNAFKEDADEVVRRSLNNGIWLNIVGSQLDTSKRAVRLAEKYHSGVYATVGLHPVHLVEQEIREEGHYFKTRAEKFDYQIYKELASGEKVVAIGECGLDYYRLGIVSKGAGQGSSPEDMKELQKETFLRHIDLALKLNKALVIHTRPTADTFDAYDDVFQIITERTTQEDELRGVLHCFGGSLEQAKNFIDLGLYIGVTGIVTFSNAARLRQIIKELPLERILVETDAPYLAPEPFRGQRNEPLYVRYVVEKIAKIRGVSVERVAEQTSENAKRLFGL